jgi:hypothetical protein
VLGKEGRTAQGAEASVAPCRHHASVTHVGPTTDGFHRTRRDSDPTSVARSPGKGAMFNRVFQLLQTTRGITVPYRSSISSFSLLNPTCTNLLYRLISGHTCFFQNPAILVVFARALFHQPIADFPLEHQNIFTKENIYNKSGIAVYLSNSAWSTTSIPAHTERHNPCGRDP